MNHLFFFTIGPVQGFIAQAKKTHDLFAGSALLSDLCHEAIDTFLSETENYNGEIIIPYTTAADDKIPNRFVGKLNCADDGIIKTIGEATEKAVRNHLEQIAKIKFERFLPSVLTIAMAQVMNMMEIYWLAVPLDSKGYNETYNLCEKMLGAIKNLRSFEQIVPDGEVGRKCIVDGERNVVIYRENARSHNTQAKLHFENAKSMNNNVCVIDAHNFKFEAIYDLSHGEGISAVTYLKRKYLRNPHNFPSTAGVALKHVKNNRPGLFSGYENLIKQQLGHTNDQLYYRENLNERGVKDANIKTESLGGVLKMLKNKLEELEEAASNLPFLKYYALISFDGDNMGEWFSGQNLQNQVELEKFHRRLSEQLHKFSIASSAYLDQFGKTVFAGEDFLGFINLTYLFDVIKELQLLWNCHVQQVLVKEFEFKQGKQLTFSAGIVIAHYKEPLGFALKRVREAAREAKEGGSTQKNRYCLIVMKHSGSELQCIYPFGGTSLSDIECIQNAIVTDYSAAFISKYNQLLAQLGKETESEMVKAELKSFVQRACKIKPYPGETEDDYRARKTQLNKKLTDTLDRLIDQNSTKHNTVFQLSGIENFTGTMAICDFIERKTK